MVKYFCDKCGKELEEYEVFVTTIYPPELTASNSEARAGDCILCAGCVDEFQKWLTHPMRDLNRGLLR